MAMLHEELAETARDLVRYVQERRVGEGGAIGMYAEPLIGLLERAAAEDASLRAQVQALQQELAQVKSDRDAKTKRMWQLGHEVDAAAAEIAKLREALKAETEDAWVTRWCGLDDDTRRRILARLYPFGLAALTSAPEGTT